MQLFANVMRGGTILEQQVEHPSVLHPELHEIYPEAVDEVVTDWLEKKQAIESFSDTDLEDWRDEFSMVERERLEPHPINIETMQLVVEKLAQHTTSSPKLEQAANRLANLVGLVRQAIVDYASAVRFHKRTAKISHLHEAGVQRLHNAAANRKDAHVHLIDALSTFRQAVVTEIPRDLVTSTWSPEQWKQLSANSYFEKSQLSEKGKPREEIGYWAIDMDIAMKARTSQDIISAELAKRKTDAA